MDPALLLARWRRLSALPGGRFLFSLALRLAVPYSGSIRPRVLQLERGRATVALRDRRRVRQHLGSVHAVALVNLGELATGLAVLTATPPTMRGIVTHLEADYLKKARGTLTARCEAEAPPEGVDSAPVVATEITDSEGQVVCVVRAHWRIGPRPAQAGR